MFREVVEDVGTLDSLCDAFRSFGTDMFDIEINSEVATVFLKESSHEYR